MTQEEKAKAYDEALERAKISLDDKTISNIAIAYIKDIFPELAESEDERTRKDIIHFVQSRLAGFPECERFVAWLEKQGKQKASYTIIAETGNGGINALVTRELSTNGCDEQKPADKVEPKFKAGDWIVKENIVYHIDKISGVYLTLSTLDGTALVYHTNVLDNDKIHLWTIKDAKNGDILASDNSIFIFQEEYIAEKPTAYCDLINGLFIEGNGACFTNEKCYPATKEQRDILFSKMKEAGYEWNEEKKELKEIKKTPKWSEEDEGMMNHCIGAIHIAGCHVTNSYTTKDKEAMKDWLKSLKQRL